MVDEAHCIKLWGEDFRQTFSEIGNIRSQYLLLNTVEEYVQESGRSGRDGRSAEAILYQGKVELHCTKLIKDYA